MMEMVVIFDIRVTGGFSPYYWMVLKLSNVHQSLKRFVILDPSCFTSGPLIMVNLLYKLGGEVHVTRANTGRIKTFVTVL